MDSQQHPHFLSHILAADFSFTKPEILNDQVWELSAGNGVIRAITLSTTFGLRARRVQLFPQFILGNTVVSDPNEFINYPETRFISTDFVNLGLKPFNHIDVTARYWVPESQVICGQLTFMNSFERSIPITCNLLCLLVPLAGGSPMLPVQMGINKVLQGETSDLKPLLYMTCGPEEAQTTFPGLGVQLLLSPGKPRSINWVLASRDSLQTSLMRARHYSASQLDEEQLAIEMRDKQQMLKIYSQNAVLEDTLHSSVHKAFQLVMPGVKEFNHPTYIRERNVDTGYLPAIEALDLNPVWSGQTLADTWMMMENLLPGNAELVKGFIENHLTGQSDDGRIDFQANAANRSSGITAPPLLNTIVLELYPFLEESKWLKSIFPRLTSFLKYWVSADPGDLSTLIRGWDHPLQTGISTIAGMDNSRLLPILPDTHFADDPLLLSMVYQEIKSYQQLARFVEQQEDPDNLKSHIDYIEQRLWETMCKAPAVGDDSELPLFTLRENKKTEVQHHLASPGKLSLRILAVERLPKDFHCSLYGKGPDGKFREELSTDSFAWAGNCGIATTSQVFTALEAIRLESWPQENTGWIQPAGTRGAAITCYFPVLCGLLTREEVDAFLAAHPLENYLAQDGVSFAPVSAGSPRIFVPHFWVVMLTDGLLRYGKIDLAEKIFVHHFLTSRGLSPSANIERLVPVNLYLRILGIKRITNKEIIFFHSMNQLQPVTVQYKKINVSLEQERVVVDLGTEGQFFITNPGPHRILFG